MSRTTFVLLATLLIPGQTLGQAIPSRGGRGELRAGETTSLVSRIVVGAAAAAALSHALMPVGAKLLGPDGGEDPGLLGAVAGFSIGAVLGTALGVYGVARAHGSETRFPVALAGSVAGYLALGALGSVVEVHDPVVGWIAIYTIPALVAGLITHQADRRVAEQRRLGLRIVPGPAGWRLGATLRF